MELKIKQIENGYLLEWQEEVDVDRFKTYQEAIIANDDDDEAMENLLYRIADYFGCNYDKWSKDNLRISWDKKGHKI